MRKFRNLTVEGGTEQSRQDFLVKIKENLPKDWILKKDLVENYSKSTSKSLDDVICVESPAENKPVGLVWFGLWQDHLNVRNIIPADREALSYDSYNKILETFEKDCILPFLDKSQFKSVLTSNEYSLEEEAGGETAKLLELWANSCNPTTLNSHPSDFERWAKAIISAHKNNSKLSTETLKRWMIEVKGWDRNFEKIYDVVLDYEYALRILEIYDKHH